ncbi:isopentenyl-diphosphate delta-isomerase, type 1, partial [mine drainage metagenome]
VYIGTSSEPARANANEVSEFRHIRPEQLDQAMDSQPGKFTPWFRMEWERIRKQYWPHVESFIKHRQIS